MNKDKVLKSLFNIANNLDEQGYTKEANTVTNIMVKVANAFDEQYIEENEEDPMMDDPFFVAIMKEIKESDLGLDEAEIQDLTEEIYNEAISRMERRRVRQPEDSGRFRELAQEAMEKVKSQEAQGPMRSPVFPYENLPDDSRYDM